MLNIQWKFHACILFNFKNIDQNVKSDAIFYHSLRQSWKKIVATLDSFPMTEVSFMQDLHKTVHIDRIGLSTHRSSPSPIIQCCVIFGILKHATYITNIALGGTGEYFISVFAVSALSVATIFSRIVWANCKKLHLILRFGL